MDQLASYLPEVAAYLMWVGLNHLEGCLGGITTHYFAVCFAARAAFCVANIPNRYSATPTHTQTYPMKRES